MFWTRVPIHFCNFLMLIQKNVSGSDPVIPLLWRGSWGTSFLSWLLNGLWGWFPAACDSACIISGISRLSFFSPVKRSTSLNNLGRTANLSSEWQGKDSWRMYQKTYLTWNNPALFFSWPRQIKFPKVQPLISLILLLGSCFIWIFAFHCWKRPWIYLDNCGYMICYFIPLWIFIQKQTSTSWYNKIPCHYIE